MMKKTSDNPADPFKKALAEATKVMADNPELSVTYTVDPSGVSGEQVRLRTAGKDRDILTAMGLRE